MQNFRLGEQTVYTVNPFLQISTTPLNHKSVDVFHCAELL
jgi:hypothetical protein